MNPSSYPGTTSTTSLIPPVQVSSGSQNRVTATTRPTEGDLATTGSDVAPLVGAGAGLVLLGAALVAIVGRRRRS